MFDTRHKCPHCHNVFGIGWDEYDPVRRVMVCRSCTEIISVELPPIKLAPLVGIRLSLRFRDAAVNGIDYTEEEQ